MKDITELRAEIDVVDSQIMELFRQRMAISEGVAEYKQSVGKPIYDPERERRKLVKIAKEAGPDLRTGAMMLFSTLFELSSAHQMKVMNKKTDLTERVAYAIYQSEIPVISAVGHEPDVTISDFVADLRAATPSNAAELAVPDQDALRQTLDSMSAAMAAALNRQLKIHKQHLDVLSHSAVLKSPTGYIEQKQKNLEKEKF